MTPYHELRVARPKLSAMLAKETHVSHVQRIWSIVILLDSAQSVGDKVAEYIILPLRTVVDPSSYEKT